MTPTALEALLKEADTWRDAKSIKGDLIRNLTAAIRDLQADLASTEAEAFTAGWRARDNNEVSWANLEHDLAAYRQSKKGSVKP